MHTARQLTFVFANFVLCLQSSTDFDKINKKRLIKFAQLGLSVKVCVFAAN